VGWRGACMVGAMALPLAGGASRRRQCRSSQQVRPALLLLGALTAAGRLAQPGRRAFTVLTPARVEAHPAVLVPRAGPSMATNAAPIFGVSPTRHGRHCAGPVRPALPEGLATIATLVSELPQRAAAFGPWGPVYFCVVYVLSLLICMPATPMTFSAGYLFGLPVGFAVALTASAGASVLCFGLSRTFLHPLIKRIASRNKLFRQVNRAIELKGGQILFMLRLSPLLPFAIMCYACGLSSMPFSVFFLANLLGFIPCTLGTVYLATVLRTCTQAAAGVGAAKSWTYAVGAVVTVFLIAWASRVAQRAIDGAVEDEAAGAPAAGATQTMALPWTAGLRRPSVPWWRRWCGKGVASTDLQPGRAVPLH